VSVPAQLVRLGRDVSDDDGTARRLYGVGDSGAVLVRPDGHIAWQRSSAPADAPAVLRQAFAIALGRSSGLVDTVPLAG
jgi:putative polyketide hydroxylase